MKIAIVDDEKTTTDLLGEYIQRFETEYKSSIETTIFFHPIDFLNKYRSDYDLVLMDIEMPGLNGIETAKELRRMDSNVVLIFITNMAQYAINGYEVDATDFIVKPVSYMDFALKIKKAIRYISQRQRAKITLETGDGILSISIPDIYYIEVVRHYLEYHTTQGVVKTRGVMKEVESVLKQYHFVRCNHGYLVNLKYVDALYNHTVRVAGDELIISRNKKNEFLMEFTRYVAGLKV